MVTSLDWDTGNAATGHSIYQYPSKDRELKDMGFSQCHLYTRLGHPLYLPLEESIKAY